MPNTKAVADLTEKIREAAPHAIAHLTPKSYGVSLTLLSVPQKHRRTGQATAALRALTQAADTSQTTLSLTPDDVFGTPTRILHRMYMAHGFRLNTGRARNYEIFDTMVRYPTVTNTA